MKFLPCSYSCSSHDVFMSPHSPPFPSPLLVSVRLSFPLLSLLSPLCFSLSLSLSADARCGDGRQRHGAEVHGGDVGRGAQPGTHRAADAHGRGQSLNISVEPTLLCVFVRESEHHPCVPPLVPFFFPVFNLISVRLAKN